MIPYTIPEQDSDLWDCGRNLSQQQEREKASSGQELQEIVALTLKLIGRDPGCTSKDMEETGRLSRKEARQAIAILKRQGKIVRLGFYDPCGYVVVEGVAWH